LDRIGAVPAILALFLYALAAGDPQHRNALAGVGTACADAGRALGLTGRQLLRLVELPLALPGVLAGIKTAAVINVGTATIAAFIGPRVRRTHRGRLAVNDHTLLLAGAILRRCWRSSSSGIPGAGAVLAAPQLTQRHRRWPHRGHFCQEVMAELNLIRRGRSVQEPAAEHFALSSGGYTAAPVRAASLLTGAGL